MRSLQQTAGNIFTNYQRLSTQQRVNSGADDAAGLAIAVKLLSQETGIAQGVRNLNDGISAAKVAEGSLETVSDSLGRIRELTIQAQNGTLSDEDRAVIQQEVDQLTAGIDQTVRSTEFNDKALLDGSASGSGAIELVSGSGGETVSLDIADQSTAALGIDALDVSQPLSLQAIDNAIGQVANTRGRIGAVVNQLGSQVQTELASFEATAAARSRIEDLDVAAEVADKTKNQILFNAQLGLQSHSRVADSALLQLLG